MFIVKDAFNLRLQAPHISLLACASAHQRFTPGDEPLGLVTALLCAGAASVLGTIWPVQSCTARTFAELFMSKFGEAMESDILNLAHAVREAVLDLRDDMDTRTPYHWAGFVLHGAWFCKAAVQ